MFDAKVILDSENPCYNRLITVEATYPRFIHSEILTHRDRARNSGSSRAIPWPTMQERILNDPVIPIKWGANQKGMQTGDEVSPENQEKARRIWLRMRDECMRGAQELHELGIHKSLCNRPTETWMWITVVMSATNWKNFFALRVHEAAEVHFQKIAGMIKTAINASQPKKLKFGEWHLPYIQEDDDPSKITREEVEALEKPYYRKVLDELIFSKNKLQVLKYASAGRCARVSYVQHNSKIKSLAKDFELCMKLIAEEPLHSSPLEHVAMTLATPERIGPFIGFFQFRKEFSAECVRE